MFFRQIMEAFLVRTDPDSSIVNPAHMNITNAPQIRKEKVLKTNIVSSSTAARATVGTNNGMARAMARMRRRRRGNSLVKGLTRTRISFSAREGWRRRV